MKESTSIAWTFAQQYLIEILAPVDEKVLFKNHSPANVGTHFSLP